MHAVVRVRGLVHRRGNVPPLPTHDAVVSVYTGVLERGAISLAVSPDRIASAVLLQLCRGPAPARQLEIGGIANEQRGRSFFSAVKGRSCTSVMTVLTTAVAASPKLAAIAVRVCGFDCWQSGCCGRRVRSRAVPSPASAATQPLLPSGSSTRYSGPSELPRLRVPASVNGGDQVLHGAVVEPSIVLEHASASLSTKWRHNVTLEDVTMSVQQGEIVFVMGSKASGKTCLLEMMGYVGRGRSSCSVAVASAGNSLIRVDVAFWFRSGTVMAESGHVRLFGLDVSQWTLSKILGGDHHGVGVCPSETFAWRDLTVQETMLVLGMVYGMQGPILTTRVTEVCFEVRLSRPATALCMLACFRCSTRAYWPYETGACKRCLLR